MTKILQDNFHTNNMDIQSIMEKYNCLPFYEISKKGEARLNRIERVPTVIGKFNINPDTNDKWIEVCYWRPRADGSGRAEYIWCDGTWNVGTAYHDSSDEEIERSYTAPVPSDCDRVFKGWFNSHVELLEAYYLALYKEKSISWFQHFVIKLLLIIENRKQGE